MIETSDIYRTLRQTLEKNFPDIKVQIKDIKNPKPPCFYIKYVDDRQTKSATEYQNNSYTFDIIYFSQVEKLQDLISVEKILKKVLSKPLKIELENDLVQYQEINDISFNFNEYDYILNCVIDISLDQREDDTNRYDEYDNEELIEELEI